MMLLRGSLFIFTCASAFRVRPKKKSDQKTTVGGKVVTLGDSYSSGCGIFKRENQYPGEPEACLREIDTIAGGQYAAANGMESINFACAGDTIDAGTPEGPQGIVNQFEELQVAYPADAAADWEGSVFSLTIGGNDVLTEGGDGWPGVIGGCILCFGCACHTKPENQVVNLDEIQTKVTQFYTTLAQNASKARIRVMGYPKLLQAEGTSCSVAFLNVAASRWMDDQVELANDRLRQGVADVKALYPSVDMEFVSMTGVITRGACARSGKEIGGFSIFGGLGPQTFHPLQAGYDKYGEALSASLGASQLAGGKAIQAPLKGADIFHAGDADKSGQLSLSELLSAGVASLNAEQLRTLFSAADLEQDGFLSEVEFGYLLKFVPRR